MEPTAVPQTERARRWAETMAGHKANSTMALCRKRRFMVSLSVLFIWSISSVWSIRSVSVFGWTKLTR